MSKCISCGKCCHKHWLLRLTSPRELELFKNQIVYGNFIWTDECVFLKENKCINWENRTQKCKDYFCENY